MTIDAFLTKWTGKTLAGERAEYQQFLTEFAQAIDVPTPGDAGHATEDYRFEAPVRSEVVYGSKTTKRIDLYKRDAFILEAKQAQPGWSPAADTPEPPPVPILDLFGNEVGREPPRRGVNRYDRLMADALLQAKRYALSVPEGHSPPPFLIVADIGRAFEVYFDIGGNGRGYAPFPNEREYRVRLSEFADPDILTRFRAIWSDPRSIDPRLIAAKVTREVADELVRVSTWLEAEQRERGRGDINAAMQVEETSLFMMRLLFCMFAEDVGLLPNKSFQRFLSAAETSSDLFWRDGLTSLWSKMNDRMELNRFWSPGDTVVQYFNGNFFASAKVFDLTQTLKKNLLNAAERDWKSVEPAIFGTLLEQVLEATGDRAKLGAHYTPRAYVERLVEETILVVLRAEWEEALAGARAKADAGDTAGAVADACGFARRLARIRILDPACGTGNFLYVAMEQLLRLEGEVRQFVTGLGATFDPAVHPEQFLGLELNPRAAVIAELVLWIGWLRYRLANTPEAIGEPVLRTLTNINGGTHGGFDALLVLDDSGRPDLADARRPVWPDADFIVGNPPFIGGKDIRERLGSDYAQALWRSNPRVPKSADLVMHWWDRAADVLTRPATRLRRFGFVTTNSITQVFSRRVIEGWLADDKGRPPDQVRGNESDSEVDQNSSPRPPSRGPASSKVARHGDKPRDVGRGEAPRRPSLRESADGTSAGRAALHLTLAIPDHPWTRVTRDAAAVRIAMTVAAAGPGSGRVLAVTGEAALDTDAPEIGVAASEGVIHADLSVGTDVTRVVPLKANEGICSPGVKLHGAGFIVTPAQARELGLGTRPGLEAHIRDYRNGRDLLQRPRGVMVIDLFGLTENQVMDRFPEVYQHVLKNVRDSFDSETGKPNGRAVNAREIYKRLWWVFGEPRRELRPAIAGLSRYITTVESAARRIFQFVDGTVLPDNKIIVIASDDPFVLGVINAQIHIDWWLANAGMLGSYDRPAVYVKGQAFDPFPFPDPSPEQRTIIADLAERLDATRRAALADSASLTMTGLYNFVAAIRDGTLNPAYEAAAVRARARIVAKFHDDLDAAVAAAYGWSWPLAPAEIVARLVALNAERAAEEAAGQIRWLRPDYQARR